MMREESVDPLPHSNSPFSDKSRVLASLPWKPKSDQDDYVFEHLYSWLDDETIVFFLPDTNGEQQAMKQRVSVGQTFSAEPMPMMRTPLNVTEFHISPNGNTLFLTGMDAMNDQYCQLFALDSTEQTPQYPKESYQFFFLSGGRSIVGYNFDEETLISYSLDDPHITPLEFSPQLRGISAVLPDGTYFASAFAYQPKLNLLLEKGSISSSSSQTQTLPLTEDAESSALSSASPRGDCLLWHGWLNSTSREQMSRFPCRMYVTDTNGDNPHTVCTMNGHIAARWLPDGKHVSMVYKGALYVVPVP